MKRRPVRRRKTGMSVKAIVFYKNRILLLEKNDKEGRHPWEFPGGGLEYGEDFAAALHREVREETGLKVRILGPVGLWNYHRSMWQHLTGVMFICETDSDAVELSAEHCSYKWVLPEELRKYELHRSLRRALTEIRTDDLMKTAALAKQLVNGDDL